MTATDNVKDILSQIQLLNSEEQLNLFESIEVLLNQAAQKQSASVRLSSLAGLGSDTWKNVNIDEYVEEERQW